MENVSCLICHDTVGPFKIAEVDRHIYCHKCYDNIFNVEHMKKLSEHEKLMLCVEALAFSNSCLDNCSNFLDQKCGYVTTASGVAKECFQKNKNLLEAIRNG